MGKLGVCPMEGRQRNIQWFELSFGCFLARRGPQELPKSPPGSQMVPNGSKWNTYCSMRSRDTKFTMGVNCGKTGCESHRRQSKEHLMIWGMFGSFSGLGGPPGPPSPQDPKWFLMDNLGDMKYWRIFFSFFHPLPWNDPALWKQIESDFFPTIFGAYCWPFMSLVVPFWRVKFSIFL